ncbi:MAG: hypothetical protein EOO59_11920 [Hymenobacter sp.]|nr:MAG: hypothetical protein EOO59_11920 [Hymenobacter sp.]
MHQLLGLALLSAALSHPALAQTKPRTTVTPGTPINSSNPAAPAMGTGTTTPGQPGTPPPVATPPGTVYPPATTETTKKPARRTNVRSMGRP